MLYHVWTQMIQRCENKNNKSFKNYGGRGISVCERWKSFDSFYGDNAAQYNEGLTIDRINNNGDYSRENCRWISNKENCRNRHGVVIVDFKGQFLPLNELAEKHGIKISTAYQRYVRKDWSIEQTLGLEAAPKLVRKAISGETRQLMREAALKRHANRRAARKLA